jgi:hypothetical protein
MAVRGKRAEVVQLQLRQGQVRTEWLDTDALSRHAESQIRARSDPELVAAYAHAMLQGADFPAIVVFEDETGRHLGDGHHRVDAATLAATKDTTRKRRVLAEIRPGSFDDALRYAMRANSTHGKRLDDDDYKRAIDVALKRPLIQVQRASEVVPALVELIPGLSARWARDCSTDHRKEMNDKRDRLIVAMAAERKTQQQIAKALEIPQKTVANVLARISQNGGTAKTAKPPQLPHLFEPEPEPEQDKPSPPPTGTDQPPVRRFDFSSYLRLLEPFDLAAAADEEDSGIVGTFDEPTIEQDSPEALAALARIDSQLSSLVGAFGGALRDLGGRPPSRKSSRATRGKLHAVAGFLNDLSRYLGERQDA